MTNEEMEEKIRKAETTLKQRLCCGGFATDYEKAIGLAKRANAIFMVHVDWGENYEADNETLAAELDRLFCIMNDEEWDSLIKHPGLGHSFKGGLAMAREHMQGKPIGTRSASWQSQVKLPKRNRNPSVLPTRARARIRARARMRQRELDSLAVDR